MAKKPKWDKKRCGCVKTELPSIGKVVIRCTKHRDKPSKKRIVCYFDDQGIVQRA